jgi:putative heme-binding domain-containing protein
MRILIILACAAALLAQRDNRRRGDDAPSSPEAVAMGRQIYLGACSACHGTSGNGGTGPSLVNGLQVRRANDRQLFDSIRGGVKSTDMPPFPNFKDEEVWALVAFVRSLSAPALTANLPGSPTAGRELFFGSAGCSNCHMVAGRGGFLGPDLSDAGHLRTAAQLKESLLQPNVRIEKGFDGITVRSQGREISGVAKNWNNYSVQILDANGEIHLLSRSDVDRMEHAKASLMPADYERRLTAAQQRDLMAFLGSLTTRTAEPGR